MPVKKKSLISTSHGIAVGGFFPGGGYGKNVGVTTMVDKAAVILVQLFGLPVEKRCNSHGESGGAFHEKSPQHLSLHVNTVYGRKRGKMVPVMAGNGRPKLWYQASFDMDPEQHGHGLDRTMKMIPHDRVDATKLFKDSIQIEFWSPRFNTMGKAVAWLVKYGPSYCASLSQWRK